MEPIDFPSPLAARPRVLAVGALRDPLGLPGDGLIGALMPLVDLRHVDADAPLRSSLRVFREASNAIRHNGFEMVHLLDPRFAVAGLMLRRRFDVPVSVSISAVDAAARSPIGALTMRALNQLDQAFVSEDAAPMLRERAPRLALSVVRPAARALPWPPKRSLAAVARALRGVRPGRLIVALPWPENRNDVRWFRDAVVPQLESRPLILLTGVRSRREARLLVGRVGIGDNFRILGGWLDAGMVAAVSRCVDAFALAGGHAASADLDSDLAIALATGGVPVVTSGMADARVLAHERNAFIIEPGDETGYVRTLNQVLGLPAVQRHFLGEEFARYTLSRWTWRDAASVYADRFAALVGRPQIPADLRAA
jgi:hypothetical protein